VPAFGGATGGVDQPGEPRRQDATDVASEVDQHGEFGAELRDGGERRTRVVTEEELRHDGEVAR